MKSIGRIIPDIFSLAMMKKHYSVFPLVGIMLFAVTEATSFLVYSAATKSDVNFIKSPGTLPRHERYDPYSYRFKFWQHEKHENNSERDALLKEIGSYKN